MQSMQAPMPGTPLGGQFSSPAKKQGNWVRRIEHWAVRFFSVVFSVVSAYTMWWLFSSAFNWLDSFHWLITLLLGIGFGGLGFIISRGLSHRLQRKEPLGVVLVIVVVFEMVEVGASFAQAAVSISHIDWLTAFHGSMHGFLVGLCYLLLPIVPFFTIALAWFDMDLDRQESGEKPQVAPKQPKVKGNNAKQQPAAPGVSPAVPGFSVGGNRPAAPAAAFQSPGYQGMANGLSGQPQANYPSMQNPFGSSRPQAVPQPGQPTMAMPGSAAMPR